MNRLLLYIEGAFTLENKICCFIGHRKIENSTELRKSLLNLIEDLITNKNVNKFLFGSNSKFDDLCYDIVTELKQKHSHIERVYVRSAYPDINNFYEDYLLDKYEGTYFPEHIRDSGMASYVERNQEMIRKSNICIFYYDKKYLPPRRKNSRRNLFDYQPKSGTGIAYDYAMKRKDKQIFNVFINQK